ncbi:MAG TPA: hypothetical protein PLT82_04075 [Candidatus Hydrogenedens sp.]|nr:hypothetical protein [Candidatus Hydrogenedens sp.]HOK08671.1 hypothetical protein [Candidatus Hydrogenedens sp.]HOL20903.1 hypothetical protein [Candidatus Hydrogenedens sp.]HPP58288.1 hypothetical protein [Candidatus Hydrogenedens sp.]
MKRWIVLFLLLVSINTYAHKPIVIDGGPSGPDNPYIIKDINISQVAYHTAKEGNLEIWLKFSGKENEKIKIQLGSPKLDNSKPVYFPAVAIIGNRMPTVSLPFSIPQGFGGEIYSTQGIKPEVFHEEFTGTDSWIFPIKEYVLPKTDSYYLVAYLPEPREGKFWIAVGDKEKFGIKDILSLPKTIVQVRRFHEVFPVGGVLVWGLFLLLILFLAGISFLAISLL